MGKLLDELEAAAKKAASDNKKDIAERDLLIEKREELLQELLEIMETDIKN